ncbi:B12-binding domain-containing radical SAM protein [Desulfobacterota bacterium M19]
MRFGLILATDLMNPAINTFAPIGLGCLAASINKCLPQLETVLEESPEALIEKHPDIIGISSSTEFYDIAIQWAKKFKDALNLPIIIGGIHISLIPESMTDDFDVAVIGEGDITIVELLRSFINNKGLEKKKLQSIPGLYFKSGKSIIRTSPRPIIKDLNALPRIDWPQIPFYQENQSHIVSARGCPYKCSFCASQKFASQFRFYSAENILKEIKYYIIDKGQGGITFYDDLFIANKKRLTELIGLMKECGLLGKCRFHGQVRANLITEETCRLLKELNFITVGIGLESFSDKILRYYNKTGITSATNQKAVELLSKYGIHVNPSMIFGAPIETKEDMLVTLRAIYYNFKKGFISSMAWGVLRPYPGTVIWEVAERQGLVSNDMDWSRFTDWNTYQLYMCEHVTSDEFDELIGEWMTKFSLLNFYRLENVMGNIIYHDRDILFKQVIKYTGFIKKRVEYADIYETGDNLFTNIQIAEDERQILLSGWYEGEKGGTRWIAGKTTGIFKSGLQGELYFKAYIPPLILKETYHGEITIKFFDGNILLYSEHVTIANTPDGTISITFNVPPNGVLLLRIEMDKRFIPALSLQDSHDSRELSMIVSEIVLN